MIADSWEMLGTPHTEKQQKRYPQQTLNGIAGKRWAQRRDRRFRYSSSMLPSWCFLPAALQESVAVLFSALSGLSMFMWVLVVGTCVMLGLTTLLLSVLASILLSTLLLSHR